MNKPNQFVVDWVFIHKVNLETDVQEKINAPENMNEYQKKLTYRILRYKYEQTE